MKITVKLSEIRFGHLKRIVENQNFHSCLLLFPNQTRYVLHTQIFVPSVIQKLFIIYKLCQNKCPKTCKIPKYFLLVPWLLYKADHNIVLKGSVHLIQYMWKWILKHQPRGIMMAHGSSSVLKILLLHLTCKQFLKWGRRATKQKNHPQKILKCWREAIRAFLKNGLLPATKVQWFFWDQSKIAYEEKS